MIPEYFIDADPPLPQPEAGYAKPAIGYLLLLVAVIVAVILPVRR